MNILPKKRWHVRTKENIARVKQDEAAYAEEQRQVKYRALLADQEARTEALRKKSTPKLDLDKSTSSALLSSRSNELVQGNKEYEAEKRTEQESKEKAIGLLTYLGQSVLESGGQKPWYDVHPKQMKTVQSGSDDKKKEEWEARKKSRADPLNEMNKVSEWFQNRREQKAKEESTLLQRANSCIAAMPTLFPNDISVPKSSRSQITPMVTDALANPGIPTGSIDRPSHSSSVSTAVEMAEQLRIDALRTERLQRERRERERAALVMAKAMGLTEVLRDPSAGGPPVDERQLPFNSAFNPELAASLADQRQRHREARKRRYIHD